MCCYSGVREVTKVVALVSSLSIEINYEEMGPILITHPIVASQAVRGEEEKRKRKKKKVETSIS